MKCTFMEDLTMGFCCAFRCHHRRVTPPHCTLEDSSAPATPPTSLPAQCREGTTEDPLPPPLFPALSCAPPSVPPHMHPAARSLRSCRALAAMSQPVAVAVARAGPGPDPGPMGGVRALSALTVPCPAGTTAEKQAKMTEETTSPTQCMSPPPAASLRLSVFATASGSRMDQADMPVDIHGGCNKPARRATEIRRALGMAGLELEQVDDYLGPCTALRPLLPPPPTRKPPVSHPLPFALLLRLQQLRHYYARFEAQFEPTVCTGV